MKFPVNFTLFVIDKVVSIVISVVKFIISPSVQFVRASVNSCAVATLKIEPEKTYLSKGLSSNKF